MGNQPPVGLPSCQSHDNGFSVDPVDRERESEKAGGFPDLSAVDEDGAAGVDSARARHGLEHNFAVLVYDGFHKSLKKNERASPLSAAINPIEPATKNWVRYSARGGSSKQTQTKTVEQNSRTNKEIRQSTLKKVRG